MNGQSAGIVAGPLRAFACILLLFGLMIPALAADAGLAPVPPATGFVVDLTGTLSSAERSELDVLLADFEQHKGSQVAVLIVPSTAPEAIEQYSIRVAEAWKLGRKKVDDGAILLVAKNDRALRIEVGYGLEGALTDLISKRIIEEIITPAFRRGDFSGGVKAGAQAMLKVIDGEPLPVVAQRKGRPGGNRGFGFEGIIGLGVLAFGMSRVLGSQLGRARGGMVSGLGTGGMGWLLSGSLFVGGIAAVAGLLFALIGAGGGGAGLSSGRGGIGGPRRGRDDWTGGWGGGGSGWGGGGGSGWGGGGGFSGGGGGSFGGGGASGRW